MHMCVHKCMQTDLKQQHVIFVIFRKTKICSKLLECDL